MKKLLIGSKPITDDSKKILEDIFALPQPAISKKPTDLQQANTFIVLQRELSYQNNFKKKYFLTKDIGNCILLIAYTDDTQLLIHIDNTSNGDWINKLKSINKPIKIILAGGVPGFNDLSLKIVINIINSLQKLVNSADIEISIVAQKLIHNNLIQDEEDQYDYVASLLFKSFNFCSWFLFGQPLNMEQLQITSHDLKNKKCSSSTLLKAAINLFENFGNTITLYQTLSLLSKDFTVEKLQQIVIAIFSQEGCKEFNNYWKQPRIYRTIGFDCETQALVIPEELFWQIPHEMLRGVMLWDQYSKQAFLEIYSNVYIKPSLSDNFLNACEKITLGNQDKVLSLFGFDRIPPQNKFYAYAQLYIQISFLKKYPGVCYDIKLPSPATFLDQHQQAISNIVNPTTTVPIIFSQTMEARKEKQNEESSSYFSRITCQIV